MCRLWENRNNSRKESGCPMYRKPNISKWHGLTFRCTQPCRLHDGRWKINVRLISADGHPLVEKTKQLASRRGQSEEDLVNSLPAVFGEFSREYADEIISASKAKPETGLSLDAYVTLRWQEIRQYCRWARKEEKYRNDWETQLLPHFGELQILSCTNKEPYVAAMENITHRLAKKTGYSQEECSWWAFLGDVLRYAVEVDQILEENPLVEVMKKCRQRLTTLASRDLARRSLTRDETARLLCVCLEKADESDAYPAMILQVMGGMTVPELLALDVGSWKRQGDVSYLEILRAYEQTRGKEPVMTNLLESENAYRCVPCTEAMEILLMEQTARVNHEGFSDGSKPLFRDKDGRRLAPQRYQATVKEVLSGIIHDGARLDFVLRGKALGKTSKVDVSHGNILRSTAEYYYRNVCRANASEIGALMGKDRVHTFAVSYVDWNNPMVMMYLVEKMNRWHSDLLFLQGKGSAGNRMQTRPGVIVQGTAISDNAVIRVRTTHGVEAVVDPAAIPGKSAERTPD